MIYFASDIHLGSGSAASARANERRFVAWLDAVAADAEAIFLVGDIFDFWFEYKRVVPKGFVRTLGKLAELTDRGIRVVFVAGNHDMWIGDYLARECGLELYTKPQLVTLHDRQLFVAHGDNMNIRRQPMLRLLNTVFRSQTLHWLFSWGVHPDWAMRFGLWWSGKSRKAHKLYDPTQLSLAPTESLIDFARNYATTTRVDHFVFGHMHTPRDYHEGGLHVVNLGGWERDPSYAALNDAGELTLQYLNQ